MQGAFKLEGGEDGLALCIFALGEDGDVIKGEDAVGAIMVLQAIDLATPSGIEL